LPEIFFDLIKCGIGRIKIKPVNIPGGLIEYSGIIAINAGNMMDIGAIDDFFFPKRPVVNFQINIGAKRIGSVNCRSLAAE